MEITCLDVKIKLDANEEFLFLDCRENTEYETARIDGTTLIPMSEIANRIGDLNDHKDKPVIVHCHHGGRSLKVAKWMKNQGFINVLSMSGGIDEWSQTIDATVPRY